MSRKEPVSREIFFTAADEIFTQTGDMPKLQQLRDKVGGSFNTLSPLLKEWKAKQHQHTAAVLDMPDTVLNALKTAGADIWSAASQMAGERIGQIEQEASSKVEAAQSEAAEYSDEITRLESALEQSQTEAEKARQTADNAAADMTDLQTKVTSLETTLSGRVGELNKAEKHRGQLQERLDTKQTELLQSAEKITRLETALEQSQIEAKNAVQSAQEAAATIATLQAKAASLETSLSDKASELDKAEQRHDQLQKRFDTLQDELVQLAKAGQEKK